MRVNSLPEEALHFLSRWKILWTECVTFMDALTENKIYPTGLEQLGLQEWITGRCVTHKHIISYPKTSDRITQGGAGLHTTATREGIQFILELTVWATQLHHFPYCWHATLDHWRFDWIGPLETAQIGYVSSLTKVTHTLTSSEFPSLWELARWCRCHRTHSCLWMCSLFDEHTHA